MVRTKKNRDTKKASSVNSNPSPVQTQLKANILSLGGDESDFDLLKDVNSDEELLGGKQLDSKTESELLEMLKSLKFAAHDNEALDESEPELGSEDYSSDGSKAESPPQPKAKEAPNSQHSAGPEPPKLSKAGVNVEPNPHWYSVAPALRALEKRRIIHPDDIQKLLTKAADLHSKEVTSYGVANSHTSSASDTQFLSRVLTAGTLSDRLSALTLMTQASPVHNTRALDSLKSIANKKGREESLKALRAIVDWLVGGGAPDRKLRYFRDQALDHPDITYIHLVVWYFEDWLKKYFFALLQILERLSLDPLSYVRMQAMNLIFQLLRDKPEQEQNLLRLLVNKLGDSEKAVASKASYHLLLLLQVHPQMKAVIIREIQNLVLKGSNKGASAGDSPGSDSHMDHARYYTVITFNQIVFTNSSSDRETASKLIEFYFLLFRDIVGTRDNQDVELENQTAEEEVSNARRKKVKGKSTERGQSSSKELFKDVESGQARLISALLSGVNRALPFAKSDDQRFQEHIDTLFFIIHQSTFNISVQGLLLVQQICKSLTSHPSTSASAKSISDRFYRTLYESLLDSRLEDTRKQAMYLNLVFKSLKSDPMPDRVKAFVRRMLQVMVTQQPAIICGFLYMIGELLASTANLRDMLTSTQDLESAVEKYDPQKRDPRFANARSSPCWELIPLLNHYHPSVSLHARQLLENTVLTANADLSLNTLNHFLDRFVYRNPKKPAQRGPSAMQPAAHAADPNSAFRILRSGDVQASMVNDEKFAQKSADQVDANDVFFHQYFKRKHEKENAKKSKIEKRKPEVGSDEHSDDIGSPADDASEADEDAESMGEDEVWKAMKATMPGGDADGLPDEDEDDDDLPSNLEDPDENMSDENLDESHGASEGDEDEAPEDLEEDEDDLVDLDADAPPGLVELAEEDEEWGGFSDTDGKKADKRKRGSDQITSKRRKLRQLPTFATYEDYAKLIEQGPEDDV